MSKVMFSDVTAHLIQCGCVCKCQKKKQNAAMDKLNVVKQDLTNIDRNSKESLQEEPQPTTNDTKRNSKQTLIKVLPALIGRFSLSVGLENCPERGLDP